MQLFKIGLLNGVSWLEYIQLGNPQSTKLLCRAVQQDGTIRVVVTVLLERLGTSPRLCNPVDVVLQSRPTKHGFGRIHF